MDQENGRISISQSRFNSEADFGQSGNGQLVLLEFQLIDAGQLNLEIEPDEALVFNSDTVLDLFFLIASSFLTSSCCLFLSLAIK